MKITPAHDPNDYEVGKRHKLPFITILTDDGYITGDYGKFTVSACINSHLIKFTSLTRQIL